MRIRRRPRLWIPVLVGLSLSLAAPAPAEEPQSRESSGALPVHETTLDNGVDLLVVERPGALTVAAGWMVTSGSADDPPGSPGLAHLLEHLLFQGTETVGALSWERERKLLAREEEIRDRIRRRREALADRSELRVGSRKPGAIAAALGLEEELMRLRRKRRRITVPGELALLYAEAGGRHLDAWTFEDLTLYTVELPPESLELWFWLESDRLRSPVFRDLPGEIQVIREERHRELEDSPGLRLQEALRRGLWGSHPYGRAVAARPEALELVARETLHRFFRAHYRPERLTLALVGAVPAERARSLARRYFLGDEELLRRGEPESPEGTGSEVPAAVPASPRGEPETGASALESAAEEGARIEERCVDRSRVQVVYRTVPFEHRDRPALELLTGALNGRTGFLYRSLVLERGLARSAFAIHRPLRLGGELWFRGDPRSGVDPERVLEAWDGVVSGLKTRLMEKGTLDRARNRIAVSSLRNLRGSRHLLTQLLIYEGLGDWRAPFRVRESLEAVTREELREAARRFLDEEGRVVGICRTEGDPEGAPP